MRVGRLLRAPVLAALISLCCPTPASANDRDDDFRIETLSTKPHLVSGGNVLVRIELPG
jgi:hypothetical protein